MGNKPVYAFIDVVPKFEIGTKGIPKVIWTFWHSRVIGSKLVNKCIDSWKKFNPDYKIIIINRENISAYVPDTAIHKFKHAIRDNTKLSDYIRLYVLSRYGGIWSDASILCTSFDSWLVNKPDAEFYGFYLEKFTNIPKYPVVESWFLCSIPNSAFMNNWKNEFFKSNDFPSMGEYSASLEGIDFQKIDVPDYLAIHCACQKVMQTGNYRLSLEKAEDEPYKYLDQNNWEPDKAMIALNKDFNRYKGSPIIKFRATERWIFDDSELNNI
jgi:hypothetical protein